MEPKTFHWSLEQTAAGELLILESQEGIVAASFTESARNDLDLWQRAHPESKLIPQSTTWVPSGIENEPASSTSVPLVMNGTPFQLDVWRTLLEIPWGETRTYGWIAKRIGRPNACRAVGSAVGSNPIVLLVPCHRVLPSTGRVGNYGGGRHRKIALLTWEGHSKLKTAGHS
ncbi:MAG: methylated-DNA--[protein]-cysteine S-methyltransferase [Bacteroidota bacterium]